MLMMIMLQVFVLDVDAHDAYRRGKAVDRQDKAPTITSSSSSSRSSSGGTISTNIETSEEIRLQAVHALGVVIRRCGEGTVPMSLLLPYFHDIILFLQLQLRDPNPDAKVSACGLLVVLAKSSQLEEGMKYFAVALVRALLPVLRHRHARVRAAAVEAVRCCMVVPDRAKLKGSGTDAIVDLVGFREENVLPVAAFYREEVRVNHLAELVTDASAAVREEVVALLETLLTVIGDRYDHQTRLLPYLLDLLCDDCEAVAQRALTCLKLCGRQYEEEHPDDVIERRQYGVDGSDTNNIAMDRPLPAPFGFERPRIGVRLYVRGNTKRFLSALVTELTHWVAQLCCNW